MEKEETQTFVNTLFDDDLLEKLDSLVAKRDQTRAGYIRSLVRKAWDEEERRRERRRVAQSQRQVA